MKDIFENKKIRMLFTPWAGMNIIVKNSLYEIKR